MMMRTAILLLTACVLLPASRANAQTQSELNDSAREMLQAADEELNTVYRRILEEYADDGTFLASLKEAQRLWVQFRDAQLRMKYPEREPGYYGSIQPVCEATYLTELTQERTKALQVWLDGTDEGDVCAGSVKTRP